MLSVDWLNCFEFKIAMKVYGIVFGGAFTIMRSTIVENSQLPPSGYRSQEREVPCNAFDNDVITLYIISNTNEYRRPMTVAHPQK